MGRCWQVGAHGFVRGRALGHAHRCRHTASTVMPCFFRTFVSNDQQELSRRLQVLRIQTRSIPLAGDVDLPAIAAATGRFTGIAWPFWTTPVDSHEPQSPVCICIAEPLELCQLEAAMPGMRQRL